MAQDPTQSTGPIQYALLIKLTSGEPDDILKLGEHVRTMQQAMGALGGTMTAIITLGEYDIVAMGEAKSDEQLAWFASTLAATTKADVETLRGFLPDEWSKIQAEPELHTMLPFHW